MSFRSVIASGANALGAGLPLKALAEPRPTETPEDAFLRTMASKAYLRLESSKRPKVNVYASNSRRQFFCYVPPH